ncbi:MAG: DNA topology modulation protein [Acidobacteria bacterium]|nr:DNA topology modulation protein [Acidobacteriota bacterium]MBI3426668.1 DNA topology modulation protein [Acidobacteriota bacterium]
MKRVLVIGSGGAGKSTFAARLARATGLPLLHLDALYWQPGWVEPPKQEWAATVARLLAGERWVMDGNYGGTLEQRLAACDTVVFLDLPRSLCLWRVLKRYVQYRGRTRPDMTPGCPEQLSFEFLSWIWHYPAQRKPKLLARLAQLAPHQQALILQSTAEIERFFQTLSHTHSGG